MHGGTEDQVNRLGLPHLAAATVVVQLIFPGAHRRILFVTRVVVHFRVEVIVCWSGRDRRAARWFVVGGIVVVAVPLLAQCTGHRSR